MSGLLEIRSFTHSIEVAQTRMSGEEAEYAIGRGSFFHKSIIGPHGYETIVGYIIK